MLAAPVHPLLPVSNRHCGSSGALPVKPESLTQGDNPAVSQPINIQHPALAPDLLLCLGCGRDPRCSAQVRICTSGLTLCTQEHLPWGIQDSTFLGSAATELWVSEGDAQVKQLILAILEPTANTNCTAQDPASSLELLRDSHSPTLISS